MAVGDGQLDGELDLRIADAVFVEVIDRAVGAGLQLAANAAADTPLGGIDHVVDAAEHRLHAVFRE